MSEAAIVSFKDVTFSYRNKLPVLENVNLSVSKFESACIVGPNGGGKTTLLNLILGLLKPDKGEIQIFGGPPEDARKKIGYMPQYTQFDNLFPVSVMEVALMGRLDRHFCGRYSKEDRKIAHEALDRIGVAELADRSFSTLSGGQKQRALIARALTCEPELLLLDEPTANIDPAVQENFYEIVAELNKSMAVLLVSHDLGIVSQKIESVICVNREVHIHPSSELNGRLIQELYGHDINIIRHDHRCTEQGHFHE
jgi:zinc transport system ATP-binding protein